MNKTAMKQQRIEHILLSLRRFDYLSQRQLQLLHNLKGDRNANRFLNSMSEYLSSFRHGLEKIYYLNKAGRERVFCETIRKKTVNIQHFLLRNQLFIHLRRPASWENEVKIMVNGISLICDAKYSEKNLPVFVEVDISQPMINNKQKIDKYKQIAALNPHFKLIWVTELESRRMKLKELSEGLNFEVYTLQDIK